MLQEFCTVRSIVGRDSQPLLKETEAMFASVWALEGVTPKFPKHYPCSALLGCVDVVDCLTVRLNPAADSVMREFQAEFVIGVLIKSGEQ